MKRSHRTVHRLLWLILVPVMAAILIVSLKARPDDPTNPELPALLIEEAR